MPDKALFPSLLKAESALSRAGRRSQTRRCSTRGEREGVGWSGPMDFAHTMTPSVWAAGPAMVRCSLTYPRHHPLLPPDMLPGYGKKGKGGPAYFFLFLFFLRAELGLPREEGGRLVTLQPNCPRFLLRQNTGCTLSRMNVIHLHRYLVPGSTCGPRASKYSYKHIEGGGCKIDGRWV